MRAAAKSFGQEFTLDPDAHVTRVEREGDQVAIDIADRDGTALTSASTTCSPRRAASPTSTGWGSKTDAWSCDASRRSRLRHANDAALRRPGSIFIAGDASDYMPLLHEAADEGRIAGENAARFPGNVAPGLRRALLGVVFTDPQIAIVGGGWRRSQTRRIAVGEVSFEDQGRSRVMLQQPGSCASMRDLDDRPLPRRRDGRPRRRAHRPPARVGAAGE